MMKTVPETFHPGKSIKRAKAAKSQKRGWSIHAGNKSYRWDSKTERIHVIRNGLPFESIEVVGSRANLPIKKMLDLFDIPQTTYNKKKREKGLLDTRDSEIILLLSELLDFGNEVFNLEEEKFQRWLKKNNISLGGVTPVSLFDSITGIQEVRNSLNRIEYGNLS